MNYQSLVVLVAEPDPTLSATLTEMLKMKGHAVSAATAMEPALKVLDTLLFDVAVVPLDRHFSKMDVTFARTARAKQPALKIVGISANVEEPSAEARAAVDAFIRKPFTIAQLEAALLAAMQGRAS